MCPEWSSRAGLPVGLKRLGLMDDQCRRVLLRKKKRIQSKNRVRDEADRDEPYHIPFICKNQLAFILSNTVLVVLGFYNSDVCRQGNLLADESLHRQEKFKHTCPIARAKPAPEDPDERRWRSQKMQKAARTGEKHNEEQRMQRQHIFVSKLSFREAAALLSSENPYLHSTDSSCGSRQGEQRKAGKTHLDLILVIPSARATSFVVASSLSGGPELRRKDLLAGLTAPMRRAVHSLQKKESN
ncbi:hypothetical protein K438DRAFT_1791654 [Mycena galopus ATCC 62051]|nr:hypothetical protein K438DRAFT_1791654 [Mycena galopus ATCC 62051]